VHLGVSVLILTRSRRRIQSRRGDCPIEEGTVVAPVNNERLKVLILAGGPDRERAVSLKSGAAVAAAARAAGHDVRESDVGPDNLAALDDFRGWGGDVVFPVLHGPWGEGGPMQRILDERGVPYVGCRADPADLCMDKLRTKEKLVAHGLPTPPFERLPRGQRPTIQPPLVVKALREGSSVEMAICQTADEVERALADLQSRHEHLLVEQFVKGCDMTVGILGDRALPPIQIVPAEGFYSYQAKYERNDTRYLVGRDRLELPAVGAADAAKESGVATAVDLVDHLQDLALQTFRGLGCRHMARVDFLVDDHARPTILEVNTIPGFTDHSLLPMAAAEVGLPMPKLVDTLLRMALAE
jgi:D-alanine-D-alanine ligase